MASVRLSYTKERDVHLFVRNLAGQFYNFTTEAVENYNGANLAHYDLPMTETGSTGQYAATFSEEGEWIFTAYDTVLDQAIGQERMIIDADGAEARPFVQHIPILGMDYADVMNHIFAGAAGLSDGAASGAEGYYGIDDELLFTSIIVDGNRSERQYPG